MAEHEGQAADVEFFVEKTNCQYQHVPPRQNLYTVNGMWVSGAVFRQARMLPIGQLTTWRELHRLAGEPLRDGSDA